jgi:hypothetical protein
MGASVGAVVWPLLVANLPQRSEYHPNIPTFRRSSVPTIPHPNISMIYRTNSRFRSWIRLDRPPHRFHLPVMRHHSLLPPQNEVAAQTRRTVLLRPGIQGSGVLLSRLGVVGKW